MAPLPSISDVHMENAEAVKRKARRGRRSAASTTKRRERQGGAGPSRDVLMANRDAPVENDEDEGAAEDDVVIDPTPTTATLAQTTMVDDENIVPDTEGAEAVAGMEENDTEPVALFPPMDQEAAAAKLEGEMRRIPIPPHRMAPLKKEWVNIFTPLTEMLGLQVRMNLQRKSVEMRVRVDSWARQRERPS